MPSPRPSSIPAAPQEPRAKTIGRVSGTHPVAFVRKPALEAREAERIRRERLMAVAFRSTLFLFGVSNVKAGEWIGGESLVRRLLKRERAITAYHLAKMPPDFADALLVAFRQVLRTDCANDVDPG